MIKKDVEFYLDLQDKIEDKANEIIQYLAENLPASSYLGEYEFDGIEPHYLSEENKKFYLSYSTYTCGGTDYFTVPASLLYSDLDEYIKKVKKEEAEKRAKVEYERIEAEKSAKEKKQKEEYEYYLFLKEKFDA